MAVYAAQVERMDAGIGRVLQALADRGMTEHTLVIFLADNGGAAEDPNRSLQGAVLGGPDSYEGYGIRGAHVSSAPFRKTKKYTHEGGIAVPFIAGSRRDLVGEPALEDLGDVVRADPQHAVLAEGPPRGARSPSASPSSPAATAESLASHLTEDSEKPLHASLSDREFQTIRMIAAGKKLSEIADELSLSPKTVSVYRARILEKMRMKTNGELTRYALENGLI